MDNSETVWERLDREFGCEHTGTEIRYKTDSLGRRLYFAQCLTCGASTTSALPHADIANAHHCRPWDDELAAEWGRRRRIQAHEIALQVQQERLAEMQNGYHAYLATPEWRGRADAVLARDDRRCQACYPGCTGRATQVHHRTYDNIYNEPLFDLVAVCKPCHERLHNGNGK